MSPAAALGGDAQGDDVMRHLALALAGLLAATGASAQAPGLKPGLQGLQFLVGRWSTPTRGRVADTGGASAGEISFSPEANGAVLLRRDHVRLYDAKGARTGDFDILMMIYPEAGALRADYADGDHVIHYASARVDPGRAVTFDTAPTPGAPAFRLTYTLTAPKMLSIAFSMASPGSGGFHPIATGSATTLCNGGHDTQSACFSGKHDVPLVLRPAMAQAPANADDYRPAASHAGQGALARRV